MLKMQRRAIVAGVLAVLAVPAASLLVSAARAHAALATSVTFTPAEELSSEERARHERYMTQALDLAEDLPGPFAAVIVDRRTGEVVCEGLNRGSENRILHGEIDAINTCARVKPKVHWPELVLYTTAEPCPMCMSATAWTRIPEVVYGTSIQMLALLGINQILLDSPTVAAAAPV